MKWLPEVILALVLMAGIELSAQKESVFEINRQGYFDVRGLNVMAFQDFYPDGHQGGVTIIQNGIRVIANGDVRLEPAPGQWSPIPKKLNRTEDSERNEIVTTLVYPDSSRNRKSFNPILYPDLNFKYKVRVHPEGNTFRISVDLDKKLPDKWYGKVGLNLELFPGFYFGKTFMADEKAGIFPRQINGPFYFDNDRNIIPQPLGKGEKVTLCPDVRNEKIELYAKGNEITLLDGRGMYNNGFFIVRVLLQKGKTRDAAELIITPSYDKDYVYEPVIHVSQVGYHPAQNKVAVVEIDKYDSFSDSIFLWRTDRDKGEVKVNAGTTEPFGQFLRYKYLKFDFSAITSPGIYKVSYNGTFSNSFVISDDIYKRHVWQPTLEYFLPVQMCHMRVNDRYRVWHGLCHNDDALMAPVSHIHFDGYSQGASTLTKFKPGEHVPGVNAGGWHDAGDYDLRVESQANTVRRLAQMWELFQVKYDVTTIDQKEKLVEMHRPDSIPDILQQIEHGVLSIVGGYKSLGRLYRGIICSDLRQYTLLGDGSVMTDNRFFNQTLKRNEKTGTTSAVFDDRWIFTEDNPSREVNTAACMANAYRALKNYNGILASECLDLASEIYEQHKNRELSGLIDLAAELYLSTEDEKYIGFIVKNRNLSLQNIKQTAPALGRIFTVLKDDRFKKEIRIKLKEYAAGIKQEVGETPFGVKYKPNIWGAGWGIQGFGVRQYFLHKGFPELFGSEPVFNALNFILGVHPGVNTSSFVSGVGHKSVTVGYGVNRADWSFIPGGSVSGTALIRPDLPELKEWPYFWQQTEYVMGGGATNFMFLVLAVKDLLRE